MPGCGSGAVVCSCSLLFGCHLGRRQAETPITPLSRFSQPALYRLHLLNRLEESMWQAGLYMRVSEMLLIIVLMFGMGFTVAKFFLHDMIIALVIGLGLGVAPLLYIRFRRQRRMREFT